jgi:hypothetical protein
MIKSVISFLPSIEKYGDGLALVGTKLKFDAGELIEDPYIADAKIFLLENRPALADVFENPEDLRKAEFIVDTLTNPDNLNKIGMFRAPTDCGLLSQLQNMQDNWQNITNIITNHQKYVESTPSDFGFSLSANALIAIKEITRKLTGDIVNALDMFSAEVYNYLLHQFNCLAGNTCNKLIEDLQPIFSNPDFLNEYGDEDQWKSLNYSQLVIRITNPEFLPSGLIIPPSVLEVLEKSARYLEFLKSFDENLDIDVISWLNPLKTFNRNIKEQLDRLKSTIDQTIPNITNYLRNELFSDWKNRLDYIMSSDDVTTIHPLQVTFENLYKASYPSVNNSAEFFPSQFMNQVIANIRTFTEGNQEDKLETLDIYSIYLDHLKNFTDNPLIPLHPMEWIRPLEYLKTEVINYVTNPFVPIIEQKINGTMQALSLSMAELRMSQIGLSPDIYDRAVKYLEYLEQLEKFKSDLLFQMPGKSMEFLLINVIQGFINLGMESSSEPILNVLFRIKYLHLIESVGISTIVPEERREDWLNTILFGNYVVHNHQYWIEFLIQLFHDLSTINVQVDDEFEYKPWWSTFGDSHEHVTNETFLLVWETLSNLSAVQNGDYDRLINTGRNNHFMTLTTLLNTTLLPDFTCTQTEDASVSIGHGRFVSLQQVMSQCVLPGTTKTIVVLGIHTTFIDNDVTTATIDESDNIDFFMMSPKWWIKNERKINLNGVPAPNPSQNIGTPGISGGKSGNFFGVGQIFEHGTLQITANGGNGSNGVDGKNGIDGVDGSKSPLGSCYAEPGKWVTPYIHLTIPYYSCSYSEHDVPHSDEPARYCDAKVGNGGGVWFHVRGKPGTSATPPTDGGLKGYGGLEGFVHIAQLASSSGNVKPPIANRGSDGLNGTGGSESLGGNRGPVHNLWGDDQFNFFGSTTCRSCCASTTTVEDRQPSYPKGKDGGNAVGWMGPKPQKFDPESVSVYVSLFKTQTDHNSHDLFRSIITEFLSKVDEEDSIPKITS